MPKEQRYTEKDVANLIAQVEEAFTSQLAKSESELLAKSEDGEKPEDKHEEKEEHEEKPKHEAKDEESKEHEGKEEHHEDKGHDYDDEDMAHMEKMYRSMSKGELAAHHDCIKKCMGGSEMDKHGLSPEEMKAKMAKGEDGIERCEPKDTPGAKSPASKAGGMQMKKSDGNGGEMSSSEPKDTPGAKSPASKEQDSVSKEMAKTETGKVERCEPKNTPGAKSEASKAEGMQMEKSEKTEVELLKSELETQKKNFEAVQEFLTKLVKKTAPQGKAITSLDVIAKSETSVEEKSLTKGEMVEKLKAKAADPSLKKSDRDAINAFCLNGYINVNSISHLLK